MPIDCFEGLRAVLAEINAARRQPNVTIADAVRLVRGRLQEIVEEASSSDPEVVPIAVSLINLLTDCSRGAVPAETAEQALDALEEELSAESLVSHVLFGAEINLATESGDQRACSLLRWETFCDHYADRYGYPKKGDAAQAKLRSRIAGGRLQVPKKDLHLDGANHLVWFTDEGQLRESCCELGAEDRIDGTRAYDQLALDWSRRWERSGPAGEGISSTILILLSLLRRQEAERGLRMPTAVDAWGFLPFAPGALGGGRAWPVVGSRTINPMTGDEGLPEGVHGPLDLLPGESCFVGPCGEVRKQPPDRVAECGRDIIARALARLAAV